MKIAVVLVLAFVAVSFADVDFWERVNAHYRGDVDARATSTFCNVYTCVAETATCETTTECDTNSGGCNICNAGLGCFQGDGVETDTCRSTFIGLDCDDGAASADCAGFPNSQALICGTNKVCRYSTTADLQENDYCCDDCECISGTCVNGRCFPIVTGGNCDNTEFTGQQCVADNYCNTTSDTCFARVADSASCDGSPNFECGIGADCVFVGVGNSVCTAECSAAIGTECVTGSCVDGATCNTTAVPPVCQANSASGLGNACNATTPCTGLGQVCQCDHSTGTQTCVAKGSCCAQTTALNACWRANLCHINQNFADPRSCIRQNCQNEILNSFSCQVGDIDACGTASFANSRADCGSASALNSWVSLLF